MEKVLCSAHGFPCFLKTGNRDGPSKGKSFYICGIQNQEPCGFVLPTDLSPSHCLVHEEYIVELQVLVKQAKTDLYRLFYRCSKGKTEGKKMCGNVPWQDSNASELPAHPQSQHTLELLHDHTNERNPFKVSSRNHKQFPYKKMNEDGDRNSGEKENQKRNVQTSDGEQPPNSQTLSIKKEFSSAVHIKNKDFEDKHEGLSREETKTEIKSHEPQTESKKTLDTHKSNLSKRFEMSSSHMQEDSSLRFTKHDLLKNENLKQSLSSVSRTSSIKPINGEKLGNDESETCRSKTVTMKKSSNWKTEEKTLLPKEFVTIQEPRSFSVELAGDSIAKKPILFQTEKTPEEQKCTEKHLDSDKQETLVLFNEQAIDSQQGKDCIQKKPPSILSEVASLQMANSMDNKTLHSQLSAQLNQKQRTLKTVNVQALPDKGERLLKQVQELEAALSSLNLEAEECTKEDNFCRTADVRHKKMQPDLFTKVNLMQPDAVMGKEPQFLKKNPVPSSLELHLPWGSDDFKRNMLYGGPMTNDQLQAVQNATSDAINQLHKSLESCPTETSIGEDPPGLKVSLLLHQKQALSWLLWRENQKPCGGILADDMGLGKTLTMIALILAQKCTEKEKEKKLDLWMSKQGSIDTCSHGTLIVCPASLIHHWKKEVEKYVKHGKLKVYLYHGPNRIKNASILSQNEIVITTYSILAKEIPVQKEEVDVAEDCLVQDKSLPFCPLACICWARIILDEAHNIKNPKVQASIAACKLRATARWAVTGTPIQNNLLDMYSLLKFLRCSPFDEFKVWKSQVDNNTRKGGERLIILTKSLLLRRTKDQLDSSGKPLISLPQRCVQVHRLKLSEDEQSVYDVLFKRSRSTLQSFLKHQETLHTGYSGDNSLTMGAQQFKMGQQDSSGKMVKDRFPGSTTIHILSLLLRLRQCCCHLSLLKVALDQANMNSEGVSLSMEEQLSALTLSEPESSDPLSMVKLFGTAFGADLFEMTKQSTKISHLLEELKGIQKHSQKCVVVSQWTSMLKIVAIHLDKLGLKHATVDGSVNPKQRMDIIEEFNNNRKGIKVLLISLLAGGIGLNLVGGNHLFLLDMHWNPALEDQACDRIYRMGQQKDVKIHRFVCEGTVEEKISELQTKKKELAQKVLSGKGESFTKLTLADLRLLFGI
ncbi:transcription termination factor 2 isoform X2 [Thamnophis elegans]|uniref:transcription termination factor 2 isoform X2 n=1 Tax=Thamnophis elegans TaxID=35005 RepID=UPI0013786D7C|nr:transcription termination factor 2 isoform X2 [Thamnophis elegans]